eukprot:3879516-Alexandrium_andersonii.AAC.1
MSDPAVHDVTFAVTILTKVLLPALWVSRGLEGPQLTLLPGLVVWGGADLPVPHELEAALGVLGEEFLHVLE